jgi:hypothetical protein
MAGTLLGGWSHRYGVLPAEVLRAAVLASLTIRSAHFVNAPSQQDPVLLLIVLSSADANSTLYSTFVRLSACFACFHTTLVGIVTTNVPGFFPLLSWKSEDDLNALSSASLSP